jgi:hypothetical protein
MGGGGTSRVFVAPRGLRRGALARATCGAQSRGVAATAVSCSPAVRRSDAATRTTVPHFRACDDAGWSPVVDLDAPTTWFPPTPKIMRHALMYVGGFERNFPTLTPSTTAFEGSDGQSHPYPPWPSSADGLRVSYMEKAGKKFVAVRVADGTSDVVLKNAMVMVPGEHFGFGVRLSGEPTLVEDDGAILKLLEDITKKNAGSSEELLQIRKRFKTAAVRK